MGIPVVARKLTFSYVKSVSEHMNMSQKLSGHTRVSRDLRIVIYNWEMVFNRLLGNGWSDLDDFFGGPHEILILMKW